jgi:hypothetical protein
MTYGQFEQFIRNLTRVMGAVNTRLQRNLTLRERVARRRSKGHGEPVFRGVRPQAVRPGYANHGEVHGHRRAGRGGAGQLLAIDAVARHAVDPRRAGYLKRRYLAVFPEPSGQAGLPGSQGCVSDLGRGVSPKTRPADLRDGAAFDRAAFETALEETVDIIVIDQQPSLTLVQLNRLIAAENVIIPQTMKGFGLATLATYVTSIGEYLEFALSFEPHLPTRGFAARFIEDHWS